MKRGNAALTRPEQGRDDTVRPDIDMPEEPFLLEIPTLPEILGTIFSGGPLEAIRNGSGKQTPAVG